MDNWTLNADILLLEGLDISPNSSIPAFVLLLLIYIFIMVSNISLVVLIFREKTLHQPMYLLFCNMIINDAIGATTIIPRLLADIFVVNTERHISYVECVIQAFFFHLHLGTSYSVLMTMSFDRYVAICNPLKYAIIMTNTMVLKLTVVAWGVILVLVGILIGLSVRLSRCRSVVLNPYCDNASLFKLSCEDILYNNIYGLGYTVVLLGSSTVGTVLTYLKIALVCLTSKSKVLNSRALQTCTTHLAVYMIMLVSSSTFIILHRFPQLSDHRKTASILFIVVPPALNAVIYGLQIKQIRQKIARLFIRNKVALIQHQLTHNK